MGWTKVRMTPEEAKGHYEAFQEEFFNAFCEAGTPTDAAMYVTGSIDADGFFYFSPAATELFAPYLSTREVTPCATPARSEVWVLVGHGNPSGMLDE